jgi:tRNA-modifying protein YgfZ
MASVSGDMTGKIQTGTAWAPGLLHFRGADCVKFLQGQLSNDMRSLSNAGWLLAGFHNPQGRVLALLRLLAPAPDHVVALLPAELAGTIATALRRYVLRAKVTISADADTAALAQFAAQSPAATLPSAADAHLLDIAAGMPQVYPASSGLFVSQMLNLDCIGAISFDKGCYTGQEIIARTHYRGRMKRRMQRFMSATPVALLPGQDVLLGDGRAAQIVDAVTHADGRTEFLAVAPRPEQAAAAVAAPVGDAEDLQPSAGTRIDCQPLPLPYAFPD